MAGTGADSRDTKGIIAITYGRANPRHFPTLALTLSNLDRMGVRYRTSHGKVWVFSAADSETFNRVYKWAQGRVRARERGLSTPLAFGAVLGAPQPRGSQIRRMSDDALDEAVCWEAQAIRADFGLPEGQDRPRRGAPKPTPKAPPGEVRKLIDLLQEANSRFDETRDGAWATMSACGGWALAEQVRSILEG